MRRSSYLEREGKTEKVTTRKQHDFKIKGDYRLHDPKTQILHFYSYQLQLHFLYAKYDMIRPTWFTLLNGMCMLSSFGTRYFKQAQKLAVSRLCYQIIELFL